jgi:hypothetical protein
VYGKDRETTLRGALINVFGIVAECGEVPCGRARRLVTLTFASWNLIGGFLHELERLRRAG